MTTISDSVSIYEETCRTLDTPPIDMSATVAIILGGGQGTRLFPLTSHCSKPAVKLGGKFKLIDVPISNAINSGCRKIFVLTQFLSSSLHRHIFRTYRYASPYAPFVDILSAEQKPKKEEWYRGTADAVRQNLDYLQEIPGEYFLILSGDQLYAMDYRKMVALAKERNADVVLASVPIREEECHRMGVLKLDRDDRVIDFEEKPRSAALLQQMRMSDALRERLSENGKEATHLASMGTYLFKRDVLFELLRSDSRNDFGAHLIPKSIQEGKVVSFLFDGYWEDIGTVGAFYHANLALTDPVPPFNCYDEKFPIYGAQFQLPGASIENAMISRSIICEGAIVRGSEIVQSILGPRTLVGEGTSIVSSYIMGNDSYELPVSTPTLPDKMEIGRNCTIIKSIIDQNVHIGNHVKLVNKQGLVNWNGDKIFIRDGVIVVPRGTSLPDYFSL